MSKGAKADSRGKNTSNPEHLQTSYSNDDPGLKCHCMSFIIVFFAFLICENESIIDMG